MRRCQGSVRHRAGGVVVFTFTFLAGIAAMVVAGPPEPPTDEIQTHERGSSSRVARRDAIAAIPLDRLTAEQAAIVRDCARSSELYRRLPTHEFACHPELFEVALRHPDAIVDIWRVLGISRLRLDAAGPEQWRLTDGYGTVGTLRVLDRRSHARGGSLLLHGRGAYTGPFAAKPLSGGCLVLLRHDYVPANDDGDSRVRLRIDAFLDVDGVGLEMVARTLQPLIVSTAGWNMREICLFMSTFSKTAQHDPQGVERLCDRLTRIDAEPRRRLADAARSAAAGRVIDEFDDAETTAMRLASRWMSNESIDEDSSVTD